MKRAVAAALILCAVFADTQAQDRVSSAGRDAIAAIEACVSKLDPALDVGYERIATRCPDLAHRLERSGWAAWLPSGWKEARNDLSAGSLAELRTLVARESRSEGEGPRPNVAHLETVLAGLGHSAQRDDSLWMRFRAWLRAVVERNRKTDTTSWVDRMIQRSGRSQTVVELVTYGGLGLVVLLTVVIIVNELRAAGMIRARARRLAAHSQGGAGMPGKLTWADIERAPFTEKPRLLMELVLARLTDTHRLPPAGAMTVGELTRSVKLDDSADRERLLELARAAERMRYSAGSLPPQTVDAAVEQGRALLERLGEPA